MTLLFFLVGLIFLIVGAELLVRGASQVASEFGISPLIIGLTVVAFGTSSPELAVSIKSALSGQADIALGNVIGSNIFNVLFILGISALIIPLRVSSQLIKFDVPLMIALSITVLLFAIDRTISSLDGWLLLSGLICYIGYLIYQGTKSGQSVDESALSPSTGEGNRLVQILFIVGGLLLLIVGSRWLVDGAVSFATYLGVSEIVIGLTVVAAGTSLPEVVTSIIAAVKGERDIAVGNVVGSNIFNIVGVLGLAGIFSGSGIPVIEGAFYFDIPIMVAVAFACLPIFFTGGTINRWEGLLLLGYYLAYTFYLVMAASRYESLAIFSNAMLYFVIPLTAITLLVVSIQEYRKRGSTV
ncbi:calcium/sodium antiporter [Balneolaceae bacterium YR4-1]|uniref:Calcium/sodium antiporter n=1 Tax=Halalkalibaculum roseum TaxID=2709311 RepID=A0A6M1SVP9_9BACT|nr:calcium/sodium antiporter [Halalkalibaculum roseum]NGP75024.1 calcium/sodium antiporter [Halalkalibaculum roseum]